jgi:hypothetical protein
VIKVASFGVAIEQHSQLSDYSLANGLRLSGRASLNRGFAFLELLDELLSIRW